MREIKGEEVRIEDQGATGPNPPRWQDSHTGKGGNIDSLESPPPNITLSFFERNRVSTSARKVFPTELRDVRRQDRPYRTYQPFQTKHGVAPQQ